MSEQWAVIPGFGSRYYASSEGRIKSVDHVTHDGQRRKGRVLKASKTAGYKRVSLAHRPDKNKNMLVHRLVLTAFRGRCPDGLEGCHNDGNADNCRVSNLRWDTPASNKKDLRAHGRLSQERNPSAKLTRDQVVRMRELRVEGLTYAQLGIEFSVSKVAARFAVIGRTWGSV